MTAMLNCDEAAEYVSALADGETIPTDAAQHIGACTACQARLNQYLAMGAELRRVASLDMQANIPALPIEKRRTTRSLWQKGWETMRIPKLVFALLVLAVVALASSLTMVKVGAHSSGSVLMLNVSVSDGGQFKCPVDTGRSTPEPCGVVGLFAHRLAAFQFEVLARDGDRVQLGFRSKVTPMETPGQGSMGPDDLKDQPQSQYWFQPGEPLKIDVDGLGSLNVTGEWMDHMPALITETQLDPQPDELRVASPILLRDKQVLGDMEGSTAIAPELGRAVMIYFAENGRYLISLTPMKGAVEARVSLNRVKFQMSGQSYVLVTGAPITRRDMVWVLYEPDFKPPSGEEAGFIGSGELAKIAPEAVLPASAPPN